MIFCIIGRKFHTSHLFAYLYIPIIPKSTCPLQYTRLSFRVLVVSPSLLSRLVCTLFQRFPFWAFFQYSSVTIKNSIAPFRNDVYCFLVKILHVLKFPNIRHNPPTQLFFPLYLKGDCYHFGFSGKSLSSKFVVTRRLLPLLPLVDSWGHSAPEAKSKRSVPSAICFSILSALSIWTLPDRLSSVSSQGNSLFITIQAVNNLSMRARALCHGSASTSVLIPPCIT